MERVDVDGWVTALALESQHELVKKEFSNAKNYALEYQMRTPIGHYFNVCLQRVSELLERFQRGNILDIGCGPGIACNLFRGRPTQYYGIDI
jgi:2-polyprenyl-3-methyl-5-hydroxy-6-metoxy-1,4-benzoquinol methylase